LIPKKSELHVPDEALRWPKDRAKLSRLIAGEKVNAAEAIAGLRKKASDRVFVASPMNEAGKDVYVHAKVMIVDDMYATIGSANFSDRSMFLDQELGIAWLDPTLKSVREVRRALWIEHLGLSDDELQKREKSANSMAALWRDRLMDKAWKKKR